MQLRPYADGDFDRLLELTLDTFGPFVAGSFRELVGDRIFTHQHGDWRADYRRQLTGLHDPAHDKHVTVAVVDDTIVGFTAWEVQRDRRHARIEFVAVDARHRRSHLGTALCEHAFARLREDGVEVVELGTGGDPFHAPARALYESVGMVGLPLVVYFKQL